MKRILAVLAVLAVLVSSVNFVFAADKEETGKWNVIAGAKLGIENRLLDEMTGEVLFSKPVFTQGALIGVERNKTTGFYLAVENHQSLQNEYDQTYIYFGGYTKIWGIKIDGGYAHYWIRTKDEIDYHGIYTEFEFPQVFTVTPVVKMEYRMGKGVSVDDGGVRHNMNGFAYYGGVKKELKVSDSVSVIPEIGAGGNTGIYDSGTDNLAYARAKVSASIDLGKEIKLKPYVLYQKNLGSQEGIAADANGKVFVGISSSWP